MVAWLIIIAITTSLVAIGFYCRYLEKGRLSKYQVWGILIPTLSGAILERTSVGKGTIYYKSKPQIGNPVKFLVCLDIEKFPGKLSLSYMKIGGQAEYVDIPPKAESQLVQSLVRQELARFTTYGDDLRGSDLYRPLSNYIEASGSELLWVRAMSLAKYKKDSHVRFGYLNGNHGDFRITDTYNY